MFLYHLSSSEYISPPMPQELVEIIKSLDIILIYNLFDPRFVLKISRIAHPMI